MGNTIGFLYLAACVKAGSTFEFLNHGDIGHLFKANEASTYKYVKEHVKKFGSMPSDSAVETHTAEELPASVDAPGYYYDLLLNRFTDGEIKLGMNEANKHLQLSSKNPQEALKVLTDLVMRLTARKFDRQISDFRDALDLVWADYIQQQKGDDNPRFFTGWPTLDGMSGGLTLGDTLSLVGRPAQGKTWQLLYMLLHGWYPTFDKNNKMTSPGQSRMLISMEMKPLPIQQRLSSIYLSLPYGDIDKGALSNLGQVKLKEGLTLLKGFGAPFWVVDGNLAANVEDIWMLARQLKPAAIGIDGGYLLKHPTEKDRYRRVAENAELIKSELAELCPVVTSWQFARKNKSQKSGKDAPKGNDLDDIGYTDAIAQVSSIVLGLMQKESVETVIQRIVEILKGRKGETGQFATNWDFHKMDFSEYKEKAVEELSFL